MFSRLKKFFKRHPFMVGFSIYVIVTLVSLVLLFYRQNDVRQDIINIQANDPCGNVPKEIDSCTGQLNYIVRTFTPGQARYLSWLSQQSQSDLRGAQIEQLPIEQTTGPPPYLPEPPQTIVLPLPQGR